MSSHGVSREPFASLLLPQSVPEMKNSRSHPASWFLSSFFLMILSSGDDQVFFFIFS